MKRIMTILALLLLAAAGFSQTLGNPQTIGQNSRNQKVGKGFQIEDTLLAKGIVRFSTLPTAGAADTFVNVSNTAGQLSKVGKSTFLNGIGGGGGALSDITAATAAHTINNAAFQQEWKWDSLGSGIGLKVTTASAAATGNTQVLMELRKKGVTSGGSFGSTVLNVINEDTNPSSTQVAGAFQARAYALLLGKTGSNAGYGNIGLQGNSRIVWVNGANDGGFIENSFNTPTIRIQAPANGGVNVVVGSYRCVFFDRTFGDAYAGIGYTSTTKQTQVFGGDPILGGYRAASTHAGVIENESGVFKLSANSGLSGGFAGFTPTWQLVLHGANNNVGIGTLTPNASAKLDVSSTTQGFAPPEMTATQASAISTTSRKLIIYVTDTNGTFTSAGLWMWTGTTWKLILAE